MPVVVLIGTLDTKGVEYGWLRERLRRRGAEVVLVDTGTLEAPRVAPDVSRAEVARAAGVELTTLTDRGVAVAAMAQGAAEILTRLHAAGRLHGVLSVGGSGNSSLSTAAMRALPVGVPKLMVSSMASGDVAPYIGGNDLTLMYSVVDIAGINQISSRVLANAADAIVGMATGYEMGHPSPTEDRPTVGATMAGVTTRGVDAARERLSAFGYEVLVFHASGAGGRSFETMAAQGMLAGVLDATLLEVSTERLGGVGRAGPERLTSAGLAGIPQVVSLGALDMAKFGPSVPDRLRHRHTHVHNAQVMVVRTSAAECAAMGREIAARLRAATGPTALYLPLRGLSTLDVPGGVYWDREADAALFEAVREGLEGSAVELRELDTDVNDPAFGRAMADHLHAFLAKPARAAC